MNQEREREKSFTERIGSEDEKDLNAIMRENRKRKRRKINSYTKRRRRRRKGEKD